MKPSLIISLLLISFLIGYFVSPYIYEKINSGAISNTDELKRKLSVEYYKTDSIERKKEIQLMFDKLNGK